MRVVVVNGDDHDGGGVDDGDGDVDGDGYDEDIV